jgi:Galactose oxidase, central domain
MTSVVSFFTRRARGWLLLVGLALGMAASAVGGPGFAGRLATDARAASGGFSIGVTSHPIIAPARPTPRFGASMAYDGARGDAVLFGGEALSPATQIRTFYTDTWTWDGSRWTLHAPAHSPSPRIGASMAYDPVRRQVVLFGGQGPDGSPQPTDTWLWDGSDWTRATPSLVPIGTYQEGMTFFPGTGTVLMHAVNLFGNSKHVYSWDGQDWTDLPFASGPPSTSFNSGMSVDPVRPVAILLVYDANQPSGNQQWEFDGRTWTHSAVATPPARAPVQLVGDPTTHTIVLFGGTCSHAGCGGTFDLNETWTWDGTAWTQQHPVHAPSPRSDSAIAYDAAHGRVVVFGGDDDNGRMLNDTWTWDGADWVRAA